MKILFLHSGKVDYLQDALYQGFVQVVGTENVQPYRWYKRYHLPIYEYPKNLGFSGFRAPRPRLRKSAIKNFSLIVIASCKASTFQDYLEVVPYISKDARVIFLDGGDKPEIGGDLEREGAQHLLLEAMSRRPANLVFKREMLVSKAYPPNVLPLNFAVSFGNHTLKTVPKKFQVAFWAVESHPTRTEVLKALEHHFDCRVNGTVRHKDFHRHDRKGSDYLNGIKQTQITLNYRGAGWDTLRYWEVTALGQFLISQKPEIRIPNNFEDNESIVFVGDDPLEMIDKSEYYLKHRSKGEAIAMRAREHSKKFHTEECRARFVLEAVENLL